MKRDLSVRRKTQRLLMAKKAAMAILASFALAACDTGLGESIDTSVPTVSISAPAASAVLSGEVKVEGTCFDDKKIARVVIKVTNTGNHKGDEVVQLYLHQDLASVVQPERQLKAFKRITLEPGETRTVTLHLDYGDLAIVDADMQWTVEPGTYHLLIGSSSKDIRLMGRITIPD